jgi:hypothetical protein
VITTVRILLAICDGRLWDDVRSKRAVPLGTELDRSWTDAPQVSNVSCEHRNTQTKSARMTVLQAPPVLLICQAPSLGCRALVFRADR